MKQPFTKDQCDRLASLLKSPEGIRTARLLQRNGFFQQNHSGPTETPTTTAAEPAGGSQTGPRRRPISIWQPGKINGEEVFVRPDPLPLGDHYATRTTLRVHKRPGVRRVCFFGESVAAGYLYAPHLTPARVLEQQLSTVAGEAKYEVVDFARTNETLYSLRTTVEASLQLQPDLFVVFAGNNWTLLETPEVSPYFPSVQSRQRFASALREKGVPGPIEVAARTVLEKAASSLAEIAEIAKSAAIPVVLVIPEVNLADWETRQPVGWLPGRGTARWYKLYGRASAALRNKDWQAAKVAAQKMVGLDGSTCPTSYRLMAKALQGLGDLSGAREACLAEIESNQYANLCFLSAPQVTRMGQELQRRAAQHHGFSSVDLAKIFADHTGSPLPGRRLFLDYCHLTVEGMKVAMAAVTSEALRLADGYERSRQDLVRRLPDPCISAEDDATAKFGAAIHSAHRLASVGPKGALLEYWCQEALRASPGIEGAMVDFVAARTARCPSVLAGARRNGTSAYRLTMQHGLDYDYLDVDVVLAIQAVLKHRSAPACQEIQRLLVERRALSPRGLDFVYPPYHLWEPLEQFYPEVMRSDELTLHAIHRSPWPTSSFCLICDAAEDVELEVTARVPVINASAKPRPRRLKLVVNEKVVQTATVTTKWSRRRLRLEGKHLREGVNKISLEWPMPSASGDVALEASIRRLEHGLEADLHPVFGEIFCLVARPCR